MLSRVVLVLVVSAATVLPAQTAADHQRQARMARVSAESIPRDLASPEGTTRWDLSEVRLEGSWLRSLGIADGSARFSDRGATDVPAAPTVFEDPSGGEAASRWLFPDRFADGMRMGARRTLDLAGSGPWPPGRVRVDVRTVGVGWLHLPAGPREVVLQRALVLRESEVGGPSVPEMLIHRWVDPRAGVVAEVWGPATADGTGRRSISGATVVEEVLTGAADLKIYLDEHEAIPLQSISYGWDRGMQTLISSTTPQGYSTAGALIAASTWDFSVNDAASTTTITGTTTANNATTINASGSSFQKELGVGDKVSLSSAPGSFATVTAVNTATQIVVSAPLGNGTTQNIILRAREAAATDTVVRCSSPYPPGCETCNYQSCGYTDAGAVLERRDVRFGTAGVDKYNTVVVREDRPGDVTLWLRAGSQKEGKSGSFGTGESRFCYDPDFDATPRSAVPEWQFQHQDADGWYMQPGDHWEGGPFNCEQNVFNQLCGQPQFLDKLYTKACGTHTGKQQADILKNGVVTVPSGHTFNAMLVRTLADFCVYTDPWCIVKADEVRTINYLWQVPHLGTVARIQSPQNAADTTSFTTLDETDFKFGLFPPRTISVAGQTATSVDLTWDPGLDTHRVNGYRVYWDVDSGASSAYAYDSVNFPGQVDFDGTSATVSGLQPGTPYYFTVTSRSAFTDPSSGISTTYESLLYPTQVYGDPSHVYPIEVTATPSCVPGVEVTGLTVQEDAGGIRICWNPVSDPCLLGYDILGADSPVSASGFSVIGQVGLAACWTGNPTQGYFLVAARGANGEGPWGHYGR